MTETNPQADPAERRTRYATAIRDEVRLRLGTNALALAERGQPVQMNFSEAETAADAAIAVADAEQAELRREHAGRLEHLEGALSRIRDRAEVAQVRVRRAVAGTPFAAAVEEAFAGGQFSAATVPASAPTDRCPHGCNVSVCPCLECEAEQSAAADRAAILASVVTELEALRDKTDVNVAEYPRYDARQRDALDDGIRAVRRLAEAASGPGRADDKTRQDEMQAAPYPPVVEWHTETQRREEHWSPWCGGRYEVNEARTDFAETVERDGGRHAWRLIRATTTYTVEAEQPAAVSQPGKDETP